MPKSVPSAAELVEVDKVHGNGSGAVNEVHRLDDVPLTMAKAGMGRAVGEAISGQPLKAFGAKSLISDLISGAKVPDYLARIYEDKDARRRLALALLKDDDAVRVRTVIEIEERKVG